MTPKSKPSTRSKTSGIHIFPRLGLYKTLRKEFEAFYKRGRSGAQNHFCWDYWHIPDQYTLLRTPAAQFFSKSAYTKLQTALCEFGKTHLGCVGTSPLWLSMYVEGCEQNWHADVPHGPWAFVYSLTPWKNRQFSGGETLLLNEKTLNYWNHFSQFDGIETKNLLEKVPATQDQLLVFDGRIPHRVETVRGVKNPLDARLVVHGWFSHPVPFFEGSYSQSQGAKAIEHIYKSTDSILSSVQNIHGLLVIRIKTNVSGEITQTKVLSNTLRALDREQNIVPSLTNEVLVKIKMLNFGKSRTSNELTVPFVFTF